MSLRLVAEDMEPESIATLQSFAYGIAQNLVASAIVEWKKLKDEKQTTADAAWLEEHKKTKAAETRIAEKVVQGLRQLGLRSEEFTILLPLASDPVLSTTLAKQILSDAYSASNIAELLIDAQPALQSESAKINQLAAVLVQAIQSAIADDPHLHRIKELQFQARTTEDIANLRSEMAVDAAKTQTVLEQFPRQLETLLKTSMKSVLAENLPGAEHLRSINERRFARAREELLKGSIVLAEKSYRELIADLECQGEAVDQMLFFRCCTNLGSALWQQFRRDEAVSWFEKAYRTKPHEPKARINKALCHMHRQEYSDALAILDEVKRGDPNNFDAVYFISAIHMEQGDAAKAVDVLERRVFDSVVYFVTLAQAYLRKEDYSRAVKAARKALGLEAKSADALIALANGLCFPFVQRRARGELGAHSLTETEHQQVMEAVQACEVAGEALATEERNYQLAELLTNLSAFYELAGDEEKALQAAAQASELPSAQAVTLSNLWVSQMRSGKYGEAVVTANRMVERGDRTTGRLRRIEALLLDSKIKQVIEECGEPGPLCDEPRFYEIKARACFEAHDCEKAFAVIDEGIKRFPDNGSLLAIRSEFHSELSNAETAEKDIKLAEQAGGGNKSQIVAASAAFFCQHGRWSDAANRLVQLGAESIHSPFFTRYLTCLFNLGQYPRCRSLAEQAIRSKSDFNETLYELAARCAYSSGDLRAAEQWLDDLVQHNSSNVVEQQKMLAQVYLRLDEPERAFAVLKKAHHLKPKDLDLLVCLSFVSTLRKEPREAMDYATLAVQTAPRNARAHMAVMRAALSCPPEFKPDQRSTKAFQRSLQFLQKDPAGYIKAIPFEKDLKSFIAMVKEWAEFAQKVAGLLREKNLPMAFLSSQLGHSPFQTWACLISASDLNVRMAYGTFEEQGREVEAALSTKTVCLDVFVLFTLRLLKRLDLLPRFFLRVLVHTSVLEAIIEDVRELETGRKGGSVTYRQGQVFRTEVTSEQTESMLAVLRDIRDFLKSSAVELVGLDPTAVSDREINEARKLLGAVFFDPMLVAQEHAAAFYADDAPMRSLASNSFKLSTFCTQAFLRGAKERNLLTQSEYEDCVIILLRHNYHFVSESAETLARLAETNGFQVNELAKLMLRRVSDSKVDQNTSVRILSDFCLFLWRADFSKVSAVGQKGPGRVEMRSEVVPFG